MVMETIIGEGNTAQVIVLNEHTVAKQFHEHVSDSAIEQEYIKSKTVMDCGISVPAVFKRELINGRNALLYEKINGSPLTKKMADQPWNTRRLIYQMAELQVSVHNKEMPNLPLQNEVLQQKIEKAEELTSEEKKIITNHLLDLPEEHSLCHGDFHPDNILLTKSGPVIIDWADATQGNRLADLARTLIILMYGGLPENMKLLRNKTMLYLRKRIADQYLKSYKRISYFSNKSIEEWMLPVAAARLSENLPNYEKEKLVSIVKTFLKDR
jgi:aminoglycoside phosphotransferase (APT) family kinase protein